MVYARQGRNIEYVAADWPKLISANFQAVARKQHKYLYAWINIYASWPCYMIQLRLFMCQLTHVFFVLREERYLFVSLSLGTDMHVLKISLDGPNT